MIVDAHRHVWDPRVADYDWLTPDIAPFDRVVGFEEGRAAASNDGVDAVVLVQAGTTRDDTDHLRDLASVTPDIAGVVVWAPLHDESAARDEFARLADDPTVVGVRAPVVVPTASGGMLDPGTVPALRMLAASRLAFDLLVPSWTALEMVPSLLAAVPGLRVVVDHLGSPPAGDPDARERWRDLLAVVAHESDVHLKLSGLYGPGRAQAPLALDDLRAIVAVALESAPAGRLMWGSDWPLADRAPLTSATRAGIATLVDELAPSRRSEVFGAAAVDFYRLSPIRKDQP